MGVSKKTQGQSGYDYASMFCSSLSYDSIIFYAQTQLCVYIGKAIQPFSSVSDFDSICAFFPY